MTHTIAVNIGIDISKATLDVATYPDGKLSQFANDATGHKALVSWLGQGCVKCITFEPTGSYHRKLERFLTERGYPFAKINPRQARRFAEACGRLAKTDRVDALMLARFGAVLEPPHNAAKSQLLETLGELAAARRALIKDRVATKTRQHTLTLCVLKRQARQRLKQVEAQIKTIDAECRDLITADNNLKRSFDILLSMPGIGEITAVIMLAEMPELGTMDKRQVASLAGLAPVTRQSGTWKGKSFIRGGRANLRRALYMPALMAIRTNKEFKHKYDTLRNAAKPAKVAITAVMRKLIILANALIRDQRKWTENMP
jgi:transposase